MCINDVQMQGKDWWLHFGCIQSRTWSMTGWSAGSSPVQYCPSGYSECAEVDQGGTTFNKFIQMFAYADHVVIICRSLLCVFWSLFKTGWRGTQNRTKSKWKYNQNKGRGVYNTSSITCFVITVLNQSLVFNTLVIFSAKTLTERRK